MDHRELATLDASEQGPASSTAPPADALPALESPWKSEEVRSTLRFLAVPAVVGVVITVFGVQLPPWALKAIGAIIGLMLLNRLRIDAEWLVAVATIYIPLSMMFVMPVAPGINGTNCVLGLLIYCSMRHGENTSGRWVPAKSLVKGYMVITLCSVITVMFTIGPDFVLDHILEIKGWLDQFIIFFTFVSLIRNGNMARRVGVYMLIGCLIVLALGFQEWLEKRDVGSMEKARLLGPQMQPNDFGAWLAYTAMPFLAILLTHMKSWRAWAIIVPYMVVMARVLLATFSRGAYFGLAAAIVLAGWVRGKMFLIGAALIGISIVVTFPEIVPASLQARMGQTSSEPGPAQKLDNSSQTRLILWDAAIKMTMKSPLWGWGFKAFPKFKGNYTETEVHESDNHNMYLYLASQMGIPAVILFVLLLWRLASLGAQVHQMGEDPFTRAMGMSATAMSAGIAVINMFGSRMVDISVSLYFWISLAVVVRLRMEIEERRQLLETAQ